MTRSLLTSVNVDEAREFIALMPPNTHRQEAGKQFIAKLGQMNPGLAAEWLNSEDFLHHLHLSSHNDEAAQNAYFDTLIAAYIDSIASDYSLDALENIESLKNPETREHLRRTISERINMALEQQNLSPE